MFKINKDYIIPTKDNKVYQIDKFTFYLLNDSSALKDTL